MMRSDAQGFNRATRRTSLICRWIGSVIVISLLLLPAISYAEDAESETHRKLADATDEELVAVLASTHAKEAGKTLLERIDYYSQEERIDEIELLMPKFMATADSDTWESKNSILGRARQYAKEGRREEVERSLGLLPSRLEPAEGNTVWQADNILVERARRYAKEGRGQEMERLMRLLVPVLEDTSLDGSRRVRALEVLGIPARFEQTADAAFEIVCRVLLDDPHARVRYRAVSMLRDPRRPEAIPFLEKAVLDERHTVEFSRGRSARRSAIETLGEYGADAAAFLLELRSNDTFTPEDRDVTIRALGRTGSADVALPELLKLVEAGDDAEMRSAVVGLGSGLHEYPADARSTIMDVLRAGLNHPDAGRRRATCTAMKYTGDFYLIPLIEPLLNDPLVRKDAESAIEVLQSEMRHYRQMMDIPDEERDMSIAEVIQKGWAKAAVMLRWRLADDQARGEILDELTKSAVGASDRDVQFSVVMILEKLHERRDDAVRAVLEVLAASEDALIRDHCYRALGRLGGPEAIQALKEGILEDRPQERTVSFEWELWRNRFLYLGGCGPDAASVLFEIAEKLDNVDKDLLWSALGATGNESVAPFLLEQARTASSSWSRSRGLRAVCIRPDKHSPEIRQQIAEMLVQDANSDVAGFREVAAWGLGVIGDETHIPLLERMAAEDPYSSRQVGSRGGEKIDRIVYPVRETAAKSIENIRRRLAEEQEATTE